MKRSSALALGASLALIAFAQASFAQQNVPSMSGANKASRIDLLHRGPGIPGINAQDIPDGNNRIFRTIPWTGGGTVLVPVDPCELGVNDKELAALRSYVVELLKNDPAATNSFLAAEKGIHKDCARDRAVFYVRALARIKG